MAEKTESVPETQEIYSISHIIIKNISFYVKSYYNHTLFISFTSYLKWSFICIIYKVDSIVGTEVHKYVHHHVTYVYVQPLALH